MDALSVLRFDIQGKTGSPGGGFFFYFTAAVAKF